MEKRIILLIVGIAVLTLITGLATYFLNKYYNKTESGVTKPTGTVAKFGQMAEKPSCPLGYRYSEKEKKCVPLLPFFKM